MKEKIEQLLQEVKAHQLAGAEQAEQFRIKYLSRKGLISELFDEFKTVDRKSVV